MLKKKKKNIMTLTKVNINISSIKKVDVEKNCFCFFGFAIKGNLIQKTFFSTKLLMNYKRTTKYFCKISFKDFLN